MKIDYLMASDGSLDFYDDSLRSTLEALILTYRASQGTTVIPIPPNMGVIYNADLFGLLFSMNVKPCYHWFVMRLNNFFSPMEFNVSVSALMMPNFSDLESARITWKASQGIKT